MEFDTLAPQSLPTPRLICMLLFGRPVTDTVYVSRRNVSKMADLMEHRVETNRVIACYCLCWMFLFLPWALIDSSIVAASGEI